MQSFTDSVIYFIVVDRFLNSDLSNDAGRNPDSYDATRKNWNKYWGGDLGGAANPETLVMDGDKAVTANFQALTYTLDVNVVGSGAVSLDPQQPVYNYGDVVTLTAAADPKIEPASAGQRRVHA